MFVWIRLVGRSSWAKHDGFLWKKLMEISLSFCVSLLSLVSQVTALPPSPLESDFAGRVPRTYCILTQASPHMALTSGRP